MIINRYIIFILLATMLAGCTKNNKNIEPNSSVNAVSTVQSEEEQTKMKYKDCESWPLDIESSDDICLVSVELAKKIISEHGYADVLAKHEVTPLMLARGY